MFRRLLKFGEHRHEPTMLLARTTQLMHTVGVRATKFGVAYADRLKRKAPSRRDIWHLDEVVHHASLLSGGEERRLLVYECDKPDSHRWRDGGETARHLEKGADAACIIVGAGAARDRIVVRADQ